ncbi:hypothetical protein [Polaribacter sp. M15]
MIAYVKRKNLNVTKYNACIENAFQSRIYAFSWYLDIVADNWDVLVLDDYKAVMPLPWKKKYGIKYIIQPYFCQQLGVFSIDEVSLAVEHKFINSIPKYFVKIDLNFNADNLYQNNKERKKLNYLLNLDQSYDELFKNFSKGRKHAVKSAYKNNLTTKAITIAELIEITDEFYPDLNYSKDTLKTLTQYVLKNKKGFIHGVFKDENLLGGSLFLLSNQRIVYLFSAYKKEARKLQASSFSIISVVKKHQNTKMVFDFEGGNIPSIGSFFKSFGATPEYFSSLSKKLFFKP